MADGTLQNTTIASRYKSLLKLTGTANDVLHATTLKIIEDGDGNNSALQLAQDRLEIVPVTDHVHAFEVSKTNGTQVFNVNSSGSIVNIVGETRIESQIGAADVSGAFITMSTNNQTSTNGTFRYEDRLADQNNPSFIWNVADTGSNQLAYNFLNGDTSAFNIRQSRRVCINNTSDVAAQLLIQNSDDASVDCVQLRNDNGHKHIALTQHAAGHGQIDIYAAGGSDCQVHLSAHDDCYILQELGLGTTAPGGDLHIKNGSKAKILLEDSGASTDQKRKAIESDGGKMYFGKESDSGSGGTHMTIDNDGHVGIGDGSPNAMLTLAHSGDVTANYITLKGENIASGLSNAGALNVETDDIFSITEAANGTGGVVMNAISDTARVGFRINVYGQTAAQTGVTDGGEFSFNSYLHNGSNVLSVQADAAQIFTVGNNGTVKFAIKGNGEIYTDTAGTTSAAGTSTFDEYNDAHLARAFDIAKGGRGFIDNEFDKFVEYNEEKLKELKLIGEDEQGNATNFVNITGMQKLHNGAIWQQYTEMQKMKELMYDTMVELLGKEKANAKLKEHEVNLLKKDLLN